VDIFRNSDSSAIRNPFGNRIGHATTGPAGMAPPVVGGVNSNGAIFDVEPIIAVSSEGVVVDENSAAAGNGFQVDSVVTSTSEDIPTDGDLTSVVDGKAYGKVTAISIDGEPSVIPTKEDYFSVQFYIDRAGTEPVIVVTLTPPDDWRVRDLSIFRFSSYSPSAAMMVSPESAPSMAF